MIQETRSGMPIWGVSCLFLLKFFQRSCCPGLWKGTNDYYEKQNILYESFPKGLGCLPHLEDGQASINSSATWRSGQVYGLGSVQRAGMLSSTPWAAPPESSSGGGVLWVRGRWSLLYGCFHLGESLLPLAVQPQEGVTWGRPLRSAARHNQLSQR